MSTYYSSSIMSSLKSIDWSLNSKFLMVIHSFGSKSKSMCPVEPHMVPLQIYKDWWVDSMHLELSNYNVNWLAQFVVNLDPFHCLSYSIFWTISSRFKLLFLSYLVRLNINFAYHISVRSAKISSGRDFESLCKFFTAPFSVLDLPSTLVYALQVLGSIMLLRQSQHLRP